MSFNLGYIKYPIINIGVAKISYKKVLLNVYILENYLQEPCVLIVYDI